MDGPFRNVVRVGLDCLRGMERTVQVLAAHCVLKQSSDIVASPGTMLAPALLTDREQQQQHVLTPASAKAAPAQRHAHTPLQHLCGSKAHTCTHTTRAHTYTLACMLTHTHMRTHTHTHARTHAHTYTHPLTRRHTRAHTHTHVHAYTRTHRLTRTLHAYARTRCVRDGLSQIFSVASNAPTLGRFEDPGLFAVLIGPSK